MKKPDKNTRPNVERVAEPELNEVLSKIKEDTQHRIEMLSSISAKAADVLKFALTELKAVKEHADRLNSMKIMDAVKVGSLDDAVDYIGGVIDEEASDAIKSASCRCGYDATDTDLVQFLFKKSRFAIDPGEMCAYRRPELDAGKDRLAYEFVATATTTNNESTFSYQESFIAFMYPEMEKTVALFDKHVEGLKGIRFMTKEEDAANKKARKEAVEYYEKTEPVVRKLVGENKPIMSSLRKKDCSECRCHREKKVENAVIFLKSPPQLKGFKEYLLDNSRYDIPKTRFQILADHVDKKSQKFVYELRFFQTNFKKAESYESVPFRVRMNGDCDERILKRFDKAVADLKFNTFKEKKNVR